MLSAKKKLYDSSLSRRAGPPKTNLELSKPFGGHPMTGLELSRATNASSNAPAPNASSNAPHLGVRRRLGGMEKLLDPTRRISSKTNLPQLGAKRRFGLERVLNAAPFSLKALEKRTLQCDIETIDDFTPMVDRPSKLVRSNQSSAARIGNARETVVCLDDYGTGFRDDEDVPFVDETASPQASTLVAAAVGAFNPEAELMSPQADALVAMAQQQMVPATEKPRRALGRKPGRKPSLPRRLVSDWLDIPGNMYWRYHPYRKQVGENALNSCLQYVWNHLPDHIKAPYSGIHDVKYRARMSTIIGRERKNVVEERINTSERRYGDPSCYDWQTNVKHKRDNDAHRTAHAERSRVYRASDHGKAKVAEYELEQQRKLAEWRAAQIFPQLDAHLNVHEQALVLMNSRFEKLGGKSCLAYMEENNPCQVFLTRMESMKEVIKESLGILCDKSRFNNGTNPPLMWNLSGRRMGLVPHDQVGARGLEAFTEGDLLDMGWDFQALKVLDLTNTDGLSEEEIKRVSRPAYALEQQCQYVGKMHGLGIHQMMNRIPGKGKWNDGPGVYIIGFAFPPPDFKEKIGTSVVVVDSKTHWNQKLRVPAS